MKKYIFKEKFFKITDKYWIKDEKGEDVFYLDQDFTFMGYKAAVFSPDKKRLFTINKKIISLLPKFFVDFEDGSKMVINKRFTLLRKFIDVDTDFGRINLKGSIWDYNFLISLDGKKIGEVNRKFITLTDHYVLSVFDENYTLAMIALVICLNKIHDDEESAANAGGGN
ncbi:LURP-one-related/scramblase family protein [uncultured Anaerococcus sp.]|uniref:LURP-one-related/scramblase family protein n=1 Tax=uncultured Anaerococcus sp. TaxID=293428 RepID=UPI002607A68A|nr:LURP-one-related family protein [uncultured Anaerococcus sp.]